MSGRAGSTRLRGAASRSRCSSPTGVNVRYLTGFESSNAALLVEPERVRLFTDFRYAERGAGRRGRRVRRDRARAARVARRAARGTRRLRGGRSSRTPAARPSRPAASTSCRGAASSRRLRAVKDEGELEAIRRAARDHERGVRAASRRSGSSAAPSATSPGASTSSCTSTAATASAFETIVASGANGARPHARPSDRKIERGGDGRRSTRARRSTATASDCTRTFATGPLPDELATHTPSCLEAQLAGLAAVRAGVTGVDADAAAREMHRRPRASARSSATASATASASRCTRRRASAPSRRTRSLPATSSRSSPGVYLEGLGGIRIEDLVVVGDDGAEVLTSSTKELVTVS